MDFRHIVHPFDLFVQHIKEDFVMLSKREKLFSAVSDLHGLICPVCRQLLSRQGDNLICASGHAVNVNRRGCVNLLSAQADTFYDTALFA